MPDSNNTKQRRRLIRYYLFAPGIIGKDPAKGWKEFMILKSLDPFIALKLKLDYEMTEEIPDSAKQSFNKLHKAYYQKENMIYEYNKFGYFLLKHNEPEEAVKVFQLNINRDPRQANSYDSLGDAYLALGNKEMAIELFQKALELNPDFEISKEKLDDLLE